MAHSRARWVAAAVGVAAVATVWGLAVSVGMGSVKVAESELPDIGFETSYGKSEEVARGKWGAGDGQFGISHDGETLGPNSFGVDDRGRVFVLDQQNERVLRFSEGVADVRYELPDRFFDDLVVEGGRLAVLSRFENRRVLVFDTESADRIAEMPITDAVPPIHRLSVVDGAVLTVCPTRASIHLHEIGSIDGKRLPDRAQAAVRYEDPVVAELLRVRAAVLDESNVRVTFLDEAGAERKKLHVRSARKISSLIDVTSDRAGNVFVIYALYKADPQHPESDRGRMVCAKYSSEGELLGRAEMGNSGLPTEPQRKVVVTPGGAVYQLESEEQGMRVLRWTLVR